MFSHTITVFWHFVFLLLIISSMRVFNIQTCKKKKRVKTKQAGNVCVGSYALSIAICVKPPLLLPDYERGTPAAPPPGPEQIQGLQEPTPGNTGTATRATSSHVQAN